MPEITTDLALFVIFLIVLIAPFKVKLVEHNLEMFLFVMGALSVTITGKWGIDLVRTAIEEPLLKGIVPAVLIAGLLFFYGRNVFRRAIHRILTVIPINGFIVLVVVVLGLLSSVITAIIAALLLVEIVDQMPIVRKDKINLVIIACFSIGLGAVLTPLGEPLSTIAISKLSGYPYNATFLYLFDQLGILIVLGVLGCGLFGVLHLRKSTALAVLPGPGAEAVGIFEGESEDDGGLREVLVRTGKVYAFVAALFLLGAGMEVIITKYFIQVPAQILFWINMVSAILDNATLTAAEIGPALGQAQINAALLGLLISGGMLIPGNIPNIITAGKLGITSSEWAKLGVPMGLVLNLLFYIIVFILGWNPTLGL